MCWEDVRVDRNLLNLDADSKILMITSAGCNALTYLLDNPKLIHSVDINPRQTALLELKVQLIKSGDYQSFYDFFWVGKSERFESIYNSIKPNLSKESLRFWDDHIHYFDSNGSGLFYQGGAGYFARFLNKIIDRKNLRSKIIELIREIIHTNKAESFSEIENELWSGLERMIWPSNAVLSLAGIPNSQQSAIGDLNLFMKLVIRKIFVDQHTSQNPYWGRYLQLPDLKPQTDDIHHPDNFLKIQKCLNKIDFKTASFNDYLDTSTEQYTHFILLDHMDWMVNKAENELNRLWKLINEKSDREAKVLFRTAFSDLSFLPNHAFEKFEFDSVDEDWLRKNDRVGTYSGTYLATIK